LYGIGMRAKEKNVPVVAFGGAVLPDSEKLLECGVKAMFSTANGPMTLEYAMQNTETLLKQSVKNVMRVFFIGKKEQ
ncbi:MAG: glycerate kinase, partial [Tyzzerella sp.]|nr:glycerate kinase [Tyzzerella sp.]